ncbi:hypothetical protein A3J41_03180 [candidate division TM6 bacterium RIFCSPHIGHO2_12_FULL_38_8]|nr:MAG: hypothetical protein A3J41_03180 [candidate division TM6 bacterium RIFCSPHIGHO2_12_FULL_38_8]
MKTIKISRSTLFINILTILTFSIMQPSDAPKQPSDKVTVHLKDPKNSITFTRNKNPDKPQKPGIFNGLFSSDRTDETDTTPLVQEPLPAPAPADFDMPEPATKQPTPTKAPTTPAHLSTNTVGMPYIACPLPAQPEDALGYFSQKGHFESYLAYVLRIITNGQFRAACTKNDTGTTSDPNIGEHTGRALIESQAKLKESGLNARKQLEQILQAQRMTFKSELTNINLIVLSLTEKYANNFISPKRIEDSLTALEKEQREIEASSNQIIAELFAQEKAVKALRQRILALHPTPDKLRPISPMRKTTVS